TCRLRAASARSAGRDPQVASNSTGRSTPPLYGRECKRGKVRLALQRHPEQYRTHERTSPMTTVTSPGRFTALPDEPTLAATVTALEEHGFSVEVVDDLDAARRAVLARIPHGSSVMTNTSVTLAETGIAEAINDSGDYDSARVKMAGLDFATQLAELK